MADALVGAVGAKHHVAAAAVKGAPVQVSANGLAVGKQVVGPPGQVARLMANPQTHQQRQVTR